MEETGNFLSNKYVLIGGVALGVLFLLMRGSGANAAASGNNAVGYNPGYQIDGAAAQLLGQQAQYAYAFGTAQLQTNAKQQADYYALLNNLDQHATALSVEQAVSHADIVKSALAANQAIAIDRQGNDARTTQAYYSASVATHGQDTALAQTRAAQAGAVAVAKVTTAGAVLNATAQYNALVAQAQIASATTLGVSADSTRAALGVSDNNARVALGVSADEVTRARIGAMSSIDLANIGANRDVTISGITTGGQVKMAGINANTAQVVAGINATRDIQLKTIDKKMAAKKSDNDLFGSIVGSVASVLPFLFL